MPRWSNVRRGTQEDERERVRDNCYVDTLNDKEIETERDEEAER